MSGRSAWTSLAFAADTPNVQSAARCASVDRIRLSAAPFARTEAASVITELQSSPPQAPFVQVPTVQPTPHSGCGPDAELTVLMAVPALSTYGSAAARSSRDGPPV